MKKLIFIALLFIGCKGESIQSVQNGDFKVELLFIQDSCKMYRFQDGGRYIYWSDCKGNVQYQYTTTSSNGKTSTTTTHDVESITTKH